MKNTIIFDLDGTLALVDHRRHLVEHPASCRVKGADPAKQCDCIATCMFTPNWPAFYTACVNDKPNRPVIATLHAFQADDYDIVIFSGRSAEVRKQTIEWLKIHIGETALEDITVVMRDEGDFTPDDVLKRKWLNDPTIINKDEVLCVFDDRDKVVKTWRDEGIACFQVAPGDF